jgi:hypothetical protein
VPLTTVGTLVQLNDTAPTADQWNFAAVEVVVAGTGTVPVGPAVDQIVISDGIGAVTTPSFDTSGPGEVLLAFVASDGPKFGIQAVTVAGAELTWTLVQRSDTEAGTAEIWTANAANQLSNVTVRSTQAVGRYHQSLTVVSFTGASGIGTSAVVGAANGAPTVSVTATKAASFVLGVGNDWDNASPRMFDDSQVMVHQWVEGDSGDTFWVQAVAAPSSNAGATVRLYDTAPTNDRSNFAIVEIVP